jgi:hypothetical protein
MPFHFDFIFPYKNFLFPGMHTEEKVLYATRQHPLLLKWRLVVILSALAFLDGVVFLIARSFVPAGALAGVVLALAGFSGVAGVVFWWWIKVTYEKTLFVVTNRRLTQFVQTSPFTGYQLSLAFDQVVDTAASTHNYLQKIFGFGSLFARSSAGAQGDFLVENLQFHKDLHNWLSKLLTQYAQKADKEQALVGFRPFVPGLKGEARKQFLTGKEW